MKKHLFNVGDLVVLKATNTPIMKVDQINRNGSYRCVWRDLTHDPKSYIMDEGSIRLFVSEKSAQQRGVLL